MVMDLSRYAALILAFAAAPATAQERVTVDAFAILSARGALIEAPSGVERFAGEMHGPYFIDAGSGPIPAGRISCVGALMADASDGRQIGEGFCRIEAEDGAVAFGAFECAGYRLVGCAGPFTLDGGEGRLAGVTGGGPMVLRRTGTVLAVGEDGRLVEGAVGIASWKGLQIEAGAQ
jgi:hypothetical protein